MNLWSPVRLGRAAAFFSAAVLALPGFAAAADTITFTLPTFTLAEESTPQTGFFDAVISDSGTDTITGFTIDVTTTGPVTFLDANDLTNQLSRNQAPYVFAANSADDPSSNGSNTSYSLSNQNWFLNDVAVNPGTVLSSGSPLGLLRVEYSIPTDFVGTVPLDIVTTAQSPGFGAVWADTSYNVHNPTIVDGAIIVTPEPSALVELLLGAAGWCVICRLRARRA